MGDKPRIVKLGITVSQENQRCGVAYQAVSAMLEYLFGKVKKHRIVVEVDARNVALLALFRKLNFRQEAHLLDNSFFKGAWSSEVHLTMLRSEWLILRK